MRGIRRKLLILVPAAVGLLAVLYFYFGSDPEGGHFPACPFYSMTGLYCTGCGSQRALHDLLHLDLAGSFSHNVLFLPAAVVLLLHFGNRFLGLLGKEWWKSPLDARKSPLVILVLVLLFTLLRNIPLAPFSALAP